MFPDVHREFLMLQVVLISFDQALDTTGKSLAPSSVCPPIKKKKKGDSETLFQSESQLILPLLLGEVLQALDHLCIPSLDFLQYVHVSLTGLIADLCSNSCSPGHPSPFCKAAY